MKKIEGFGEVVEVGAKRVLVPGPYVCKITAVTDNTAREYLEINFDITEGAYKDYFGDIEKAIGKNYARAFRSYTDKALPYFKAFVTAVEKSNKGYAWDWNEQSLIGKTVVIVFGEEEYDDGQSNEIKKNVKPQEFRSTEALREGKIKTPELKMLDDAKRKEIVTRAVATNTKSSVPQSKNLKAIEVADEDLPF
jgi:hypothetical protein